MNIHPPVFAFAVFLATASLGGSKELGAETAVPKNPQVTGSDASEPEKVMDTGIGGGNSATQAFWDALPALQEYDEIGSEKWVNRMNGIMTAVKDRKMTADESIEVLSTLYLDNSSLFYFCPPDSEGEGKARERRKETTEEMLKVLRLIPNLEKSYAEYIRTACLVKKRNVVAQPIYFRRWHVTELTRPGNEWKNFSMLSILSTPDAVRILGGFLDDPMLNRLAATNLLDMHLASKPSERNLEGKKMSSEEIQLWKNWYDQVKAGQRTFSFKGNPQEYDLNGPVRGAKHPDAVVPLVR